MFAVKLSSNGQITLPKTIREKLQAKPGDDLFIYEKNGKICLDNSDYLNVIRKENEQKDMEAAVAKVQKAFAGEAEKAGFKSEEEMQEYLLQIRKEIRGY